MADINLSLAEFDQMRMEKAVVDAKCVALETSLREALASDPSGRVQALNQLARHMLTVCRFAVANLTPIEVRGWPWPALKEVADGIKDLPDVCEDDLVLAGEFNAFVESIRNNELLRGRERERQINLALESRSAVVSTQDAGRPADSG